MTTGRLSRTARGRALPRSHDTATVSWPPALRGSSTLLCVLLLGWLGGGLLATAVALVTQGQNDLMYGLTNTAAACVGLLLLVLAGPRDTGRRGRRPAADADGLPPVRVPAQAEAPAEREPALH